MPIVAALLLAAAATRGRADVQPETTGRVETLPQPFGAHWVWVSDLVLERSALIDVDQGRFLGLINGGYGPIAPLFPSRRREIYLPATYYSRRTHGVRTDVLEIYDATTLAYVSEIILPPKRATNAVAVGQAALSDDDRFVAVFNWTTGTSLTIVDVERRAVTADIQIPGCSLVYAAGPRRFMSLCGDGALLVVTVDDDGREASKTRTAPFFDPRKDPVTEKAVRNGNEWVFVSFEGHGAHGRRVGRRARVAADAVRRAVAVGDGKRPRLVVAGRRRPTPGDARADRPALRADAPGRAGHAQGSRRRGLGL